MDKQYKHLMEQQNIPEKVTTDFYERLEKKTMGCRSFRWKAALIAVCLLLIIPITALAVGNIFGKPKVKIGKMEYIPGKNGYSVTFDDVKSFSLSAFPENIQSIKRDTNAYFDSWQDAGARLGIGLLKNTVLDHETTLKSQLSDINKYHCEIIYRTASSKLYYVGINAKYRRQHMDIEMSAVLTIENPDLTEDTTNAIHSVTRVDIKDVITALEYEEYTTKEGIPAVIVAFKRENAPKYNRCYHAVFSVDNITYDIRFWSNNGEEAMEREIVMEVIDGFVLD